MKTQLHTLVALSIFILFSATLCIAKDGTTVRIVRNGTPVSLVELLTEEDGKHVLVIEENQTVQALTAEGVRLVSNKPEAVAVLNGNVLVAITPNAEAVITAKKNNVDLLIDGLDSFVVRVENGDNSRRIVAQSTFLPFKTVKDNFGKKFAQSYFVIQVDIRNEKLNKQFIVQTIDVLVDPGQCRRGREVDTLFPARECRQIFDKYFKFPAMQQGVRREEVIAGAKADLDRSNRNVGFRILAFTASMGTILTGFNGVLGPDGVKGVNVLGTTVTAATNGLIPDHAAEKLDNIRNASPTEDVIIRSKESKTFNVFIPTERVFWSDSWREYIKPARDSTFDTYKLKAVLDLVLLSSATGVLVDNDAPKVKVTSGDKVEEQAEKFQIGELPEGFLATTKDANVVLIDLREALSSKETHDAAEDTLRTIYSDLQKDADLKAYFDEDRKATSVTFESPGAELRFALIRIRSKVLLAGDDELVNRINQKIVKEGR